MEPCLVKLIPIGMYFDHGPSVELNRPNVAAAYKAHEERAAGKPKSLKPGDHIPLKGVNIEVVMSGTQAITSPLKGVGAKNAAADRICRKRLKYAIPALLEAMERHGRLKPRVS